MANEFITVWKDQNLPDYAINAQHLHFMMPSLSCIGNSYLATVSGQPRQITVEGNLAVKIVVGGVQKVVKMPSELTFDPQTKLDSGSTFQAGKDYYIYIVDTASGGDLKVSLNSAFPAGATAANSRRIGGFHTLCVGVGSNIPGHPLANFIAGDILPASIWDLKRGPYSDPEGMVFNKYTNTWVDIYFQSGSGVATKSVFNGTITHTQSYNSHSEDLAAVGKRLFLDTEFTTTAMGTVPLLNIQGGAIPVTTGGHLNTAGQRIISNIGCEDMCGVYHNLISPAFGWAPVSQGSVAFVMTNATPAGQGQYSSPMGIIVAGGNVTSAAVYSGPRSRVGSFSVATLSSGISARGASGNISRV